MCDVLDKVENRGIAKGKAEGEDHTNVRNTPETMAASNADPRSSHRNYSHEGCWHLRHP